MQEETLTEKIILELDMIRTMSRLTVFAIQNDSEETERGSIEGIFEDIEKRCWNISELVEKIENKVKELKEITLNE